VAGHLAERFWAVMRRGMPYVICDTDGTPVTPAQAKQIITEQWTVPAEARSRRRSKKAKKAGKAPHQALTGHAKPDTQKRRHTRRPSPPTILTMAVADVKQPDHLTPDPR
jgi:sRNA-binding protein